MTTMTNKTNFYKIVERLTNMFRIVTMPNKQV